MKKSVGKGDSWREFVKSSVAKHRGPQPARLHRTSERMLVIPGCLRMPSPSASKELSPLCSSYPCFKEVEKGPHVWHWLPEMGTSGESADGLLSPPTLGGRRNWMWCGYTFCVCFFTCVFHDCTAPAALRAHQHLLPQRCIAKRMYCCKVAHSPVLEWHNANYSSMFKLFRDGNPTPTAMKENCVPSCSGNWAGFLPCLAKFLPWGQRRYYLAARVHQYELI